jgi:hypothetical protein
MGTCLDTTPVCNIRDFGRRAMGRSSIPGRSLRLQDVRVDWAASMPEYFSDGVRVENFHDLTIDGLAARQPQSSSRSAIYLSYGSGVSITNSRALPGTRTFLRLDRVAGRRVFVNCDLKAAAQAIEPVGKRFDTVIGVPVATPQAAKH